MWSANACKQRWLGSADKGAALHGKLPKNAAISKLMVSIHPFEGLPSGSKAIRAGRVHAAVG
jgi:hypothetical protein